ncbi:hypothetical protein NIES2101_31930 [Calothrix sp. HK-06]|nr:hypothetical protein NIES2101_31930 [Calothrix sp. HK-06]
MPAATHNSSASASVALTVASTATPALASPSQIVVYQMQTTHLLKLLSRIFPTWSCTPQWLQAKVRGSSTSSYTFAQGVWLRHIGVPGGSRKEHLWEIKIDSVFTQRIQTLYEQIINNQTVSTVISSTNSQYPYTHKDLYYRSPAEIKIAQALEKRAVLFFASARCRIPSRNTLTETKEVDFLVFYKGSTRILEVDGREYHQDREKDYKRDRMFDRQGLVTTRFSGSECLNNPDEVVEEFLGLFRVA